MGQHADYLKAIINEKVRKGMHPEQAIRRLKKKFSDSATDHDRRIEDLLELYEGAVNPTIQREYDFLSGQAKTERERVAELEELERAGWRP